MLLSESFYASTPNPESPSKRAPSQAALGSPRPVPVVWSKARLRLVDARKRQVSKEDLAFELRLCQKDAP